MGFKFKLMLAKLNYLVFGDKKRCAGKIHVIKFLFVLIKNLEIILHYSY